MPRRVAIVQSNYIPWKGYFDLINSVDEFIFLDEVQYTRRDWRNRNRIKTPAGSIWLTVPVAVKGKYEQRIDETLTTDSEWPMKHWRAIRLNYGRAAHFATYGPVLEDLYTACTDRHLSLINRTFVEAICRCLNIRTKLSWSSDYPTYHGVDKTERLVHLCQQVGAREYLSGPSAGGYIDPAAFLRAEIVLTYMSYADYPEYRQLFPPFDHAVSIIDLLLNEGPQAPGFMHSFDSGNNSVRTSANTQLVVG